MSVYPEKKALGTYLIQSMPWGLFQGGAALCSDGIVRKLKRIAMTADTFFSIPASVEVKGRTVAGYVGVETMAGFSTETKDDPAVVRFHRYGNRVNAGLLPSEKLVFAEKDLQPIKVLSIDAWREAEGGWTWNNWFHGGFVPLYVCDMKPRQLLAYLREAGFVAGQGKLAVEDDQYNIVIKMRSNGRPILALEYGAASA